MNTMRPKSLDAFFFALIYLFTIINVVDSPQIIETVDVFVSTNLEVDCNAMHVNGCLTDKGIIVLNPFMYEKQGCTILGHELYHWFGYQEHEIPYCENSQEFR